MSYNLLQNWKGPTSIIISFFIMLILLQNALGAGGFNTGDGNTSSGNPLVGNAFDDFQLISLEVDVFLNYKNIGETRALEDQLVNVMWNASTLPATNKTMTLSSETDGRGKALFRIPPGDYIINIVYEGISRNASFVMDSDDTLHTVNWTIGKLSLDSYQLEFKDERQEGILVNGDTLLMVYDDFIIINDPFLVTLKMTNSTQSPENLPTITDGNLIVLSDDLVPVGSKLGIVNEVITQWRFSLVLTPVDNFFTTDLTIDNNISAEIYDVVIQGAILNATD